MIWYQTQAVWDLHGQQERVHLRLCTWFHVATQLNLYALAKLIAGSKRKASNSSRRRWQQSSPTLFYTLSYLLLENSGCERGLNFNLWNFKRNPTEPKFWMRISELHIVRFLRINMNFKLGHSNVVVGVSSWIRDLFEYIAYFRASLIQ